MAIGELIAAAVPGAISGGGSFVDGVGRLGGRLHPAVVHFPIALLMIACLSEMWWAWWRARESSNSDERTGPSLVGLVVVGLGAAAAAFAAGMGWLNASYEHAAMNSAVLTAHRWIGVSVAAGAAVVLGMGWTAARRGSSVLPYRLGLITITLAIAIGSHLGGMLTFGDGYLRDAIAALFRMPNADSRTPTPAPDGPPLADVHFPDDGHIQYAAHVRPIFAAACYECHGPDKQKGDLRLDDKAAAMEGGRSGVAIIPGRSDDSLLIQRVLGLGDDDQMPLDRPPLDEEQARILRSWIDQGAQWPDQPAVAAAGEPRAPGDSRAPEASGTEPRGGPGQTLPTRIARVLGELHVLTVHFPLALLVVAPVVYLCGSRWRSAAIAARVCVVIGTVGALAAAGLGWINASVERGGLGADTTTLSVHRWVGIAVAAIGVLATIAVLRSGPGTRRGVAALLLALAALAALGGHFGGMLVHGDGYVWEAVRRVVGG